MHVDDPTFTAPSRSFELVVLAGSALPLLALAPPLPPIPGALAVTGLAAVLLALWYVPWWRTDLLPPATGTVAGRLGALAGFEATALALDGAPWAATLLGEAIVLAGLAAVLRSRAMLEVATTFGVVGWLVALFDAVPPFTVLIFPARPFIAATQADVGALVGRDRCGVAAGRSGAGRAVGGTAPGHAAGQCAARPAVGGGRARCALRYDGEHGGGRPAGAAQPGRVFTGHVVVTVSWTVAALVLLARGLRSVPIRAAGLSLVGAAVAKLVLFDLSALDGVARVVAFLGAGLVLLAAGTRYARMVAEAEPDPG